MYQPIVVKRQRVDPTDVSETKEADSHWMLPDAEWAEMKPVDGMIGGHGKDWREGIKAPNGEIYVGYKPSTNKYWTVAISDAEWEDAARMCSTTKCGLDESREILQTKLLFWGPMNFNLEIKFRIKTHDSEHDLTTFRFLTQTFRFVTMGRKLNKQDRPFRNVFEAVIEGKATGPEKNLMRRLVTQYGSSLMALRENLLLDNNQCH